MPAIGRPQLPAAAAGQRRQPQRGRVRPPRLAEAWARLPRPDPRRRLRRHEPARRERHPDVGCRSSIRRRRSGLPCSRTAPSMGLWEMGKYQLCRHAVYASWCRSAPLPAAYGVITRRAQLQQITQTLHAGNGVLALNDAILAAYKQMTQTYAPNYSNAVLVLTVRRRQCARRHAAQRAAGQAARPVQPEPQGRARGHHVRPARATSPRCSRSPSATGGVAYQISNPAEVGKIFIEAISQRMCDQGCAAP